MKPYLTNGLVLFTCLALLIACSKTAENKEGEVILYPIKESSKWGYINADGKIVVAPAFDHAWDFKNGIGRIKQNGKYGFVNAKGEVIIQPGFAFADDFQGGFARVNTKDTTILDVAFDGFGLNYGWSFINKKGVIFSQTFARAEFVSPGVAQVKDNPSYDTPWSYAVLADETLTTNERNTEAIFVFNGHELAPASDPTTGKIGMINKYEQWVIQPVFDNLEPYSEGLAQARKDNLFGYVDLAGKWIYQQVVPVDQYFYLPSDFKPFSNGLAAIRLDRDNYTYINKQGKPAFKQRFKSAASFSAEGYAIVSTEAGTGLIDTQGNFVIKPNLSIVHVEKGVVVYQSNQRYGAKDLKTQKEIVPAKYDVVEITGNLIRIRNKGATYGYIDKQGKFVIAPQFENAWEFNKGRAIVSKKDNYFYVDRYGKILGDVPSNEQPYAYTPSSSLFATNENDKFGYSRYDDGGEVIPATYDFAVDFEGNIARVNIGATMNEERWAYEGGKWGLINDNGKAVTPVAYELILPFRDNVAMFNVGGEATYTLCDGECEESVFYTCTGGKWGLISRDGKVVVDAVYERLIPFGQNYLAQQEDKYSIINAKAETIYPPQLSLDIEEPDYQGFIITKVDARFVKAIEDGKTGVIGSDGKWMVNPSYEDIIFENETAETPYTEGLLLVKSDGRWGAIDKSGTVIITAQFELMRPFSNGYAAVQQGGRWGFVNRNNELVVPPSYYSVRNFQGDAAIVQSSEGSPEGVINAKGEVVFAPSPGVTLSYTGFEHGLCIINGTQESTATGYPTYTCGVINSKGKIIFNKSALDEARIQPNGLLYVIKNGKWAMATHQGIMLTGFNYNWIEPYTGQELIRCNVGGEVMYPEHEMPEDAYGGRWGLLDKTGALRVPVQFSELGSFQEGLAPARTAEDLDEIGYVDFNGKAIREMKR